MSWEEVPFTKAPADQEALAFRYDWLINNPTYAGYALKSFSFSVFDSLGEDVSAIMLAGTISNDDKFLWVVIKGGTSPNDYYLKGRVVFSKSGCQDFVKEWEVLIQVRQEGI